MELSQEKSERQAEAIIGIAIYIEHLDIEYCKTIGKEFIDRASYQESAMLLNPSHPQIKNDILRTQGEALLELCRYAESLKEIQRMKKELGELEANQEVIKNMFI
jgi:hypothetical protein